MTTMNYKYDVAFSFVQKDENLAIKLYNHLKVKLSCFIYTEQQERLAGADGEIIFNSVFSKESRIVVVLYREEWGKTKWTRIEETAIRNKGFNDGYNFVILILTETNIHPPEWLPRSSIWIDLKSMGIEKVAAAIEARVRDFDGTIKIESIPKKVLRKEKEKKDRQKRELLLNSTEIIDLAFKEHDKVIKEIEQLVTEIKNNTTDRYIEFRNNNQYGCDILCPGYFLTFKFYPEGTNNSEVEYLYIALFQGYIDNNGNPDALTTNVNIDLIRVRFDINDLNKYGWTQLQTRKDFMTSRELVEYWFNKLITLVTKERLK